MLTALRAVVASGVLLLSGPLTGSQTGTAPPPVREQQQWVLNALNVEQAWSVTKGEGVTVAVIDSGVDPRLKELRGRVTVGPNLSSPESREESTPGRHGTAMASLIAGSGADGGLVGVAPKARILSLPLVPEEPDGGAGLIPPGEDFLGSSRSALARAIRYAADQGADVISMSVGNHRTDRSEREAVSYALGRGAVLVAAVGNDGQSLYTQMNGTSYWTFPAGYPGVIGVGAVDKNGKAAAFSSDNMSVLVAAPGVGVPVADRNGHYPLTEGTSAAAALVAGVTALIKARYPDMRPEQVAQALTASTHGRPFAGYDDKVGFGVVDAAAALGAAERLSGQRRSVAVPDETHFGAGEDSPLPSRPGPDPVRLWIFGGGALLGLVAFGWAVAVLNQRR
ncbi:S8 family serine peptidase [Thermoactinospora rubra]|uniref:S8 family serine peptidase n=1 Tax=Thermoactinospora rubra TaxID=1088767 RepID=UPI000A0F68A4|nr:S8 family serine peptidase [Thermoactinospora rubra]